jgi:hypothetical protein
LFLAGGIWNTEEPEGEHAPLQELDRSEQVSEHGLVLKDCRNRQQEVIVCDRAFLERR